MSTAVPRVWTGRTFLFWLLSFFAVIFAANIVFVWFATDSWSGLAAEESYRRGLDYNRILDRAARQNALGWYTEVGFEQSDANTGRLFLILRDRDGVAMENRDVVATLSRPVGAGEGLAVDLLMTKPGHYAARVELPSAGQWDARFEVKLPDTEPYLVEVRIWSK